MLQKQSVAPVNMAVLNQASLPKSPYEHVGGPKDTQSPANLQALANAARIHAGRMLALQRAIRQQPIPQNFLPAVNTAPREAGRLIQNANRTPSQAAPTSKGHANQASPLPAPRARAAIPQNLLEGQPASPFPQPAQCTQNTPGEPAQQNVEPKAALAQYQLPPMDLNNLKLKNHEEAQRALFTVAWMPITRNHGVPTTYQERMPYVKSIYDGLIALDQVRDNPPNLADIQKFSAIDGAWGTKPACIEAIAHQVVDTCIGLHLKGMNGFQLVVLTKELCNEDHVFTFAQRIYFMAKLMRHFKFPANLVMTSMMTKEYLACIWSTLKDRIGWVKYWTSLSPEQQNYEKNVRPYQNVPVSHPTPEEWNYIQMLYNQDEAKKQQKMERRQIEYMQQYQPGGSRYHLRRQQEPQRPQTQQEPSAPGSSKRTVNSVENLEVDPSPKWRAEESTLAREASPEQTQEPELQEKPAERDAHNSQIMPSSDLKDQSSNHFMSREEYDRLQAAAGPEDGEVADHEGDFDTLFSLPIGDWDGDNELLAEGDVEGQDGEGEQER